MPLAKKPTRTKAQLIDMDLSSDKESISMSCSCCGDRWVQEVILDKRIEALCKHFTFELNRLPSGEVSTTSHYDMEPVRLPRKKKKRLNGNGLRVTCIKVKYPFHALDGTYRKYLLFSNYNRQ